MWPLHYLHKDSARAWVQNRPMGGTWQVGSGRPLQRLRHAAATKDEPDFALRSKRLWVSSIYWQAPHTWGVSPHMGRLLGRLPCMGRPSIDGKSPYMGTLTIKEKASHVCGDFPCIGSLPIHGDSSRVWGLSPYREGLPTYGKFPHIRGGGGSPHV
jgi:hypothetical protein